MLPSAVEEPGRYGLFVLDIGLRWFKVWGRVWVWDSGLLVSMFRVSGTVVDVQAFVAYMYVEFSISGFFAGTPSQTKQPSS